MPRQPILAFPAAKTANRLKKKASRFPRPRAAGRPQQVSRFKEQFDRLEYVLTRPNSTIELRHDPFGIAPERALILETAVTIGNFARVARQAGLEVIAETELSEEYALPDGLLSENAERAKPTLYATMPTEHALNALLRLWRSYQNGDSFPHGNAPWWQLFDMLAALRTWGPSDRLTERDRLELKDRIDIDENAEIRIELEYWPTYNQKRLEVWRRNTEDRVAALKGRIIHRSNIHEDGFRYDAVLVGFMARIARQIISDPDAPEGIATLDGLQFILPQKTAQSIQWRSDYVGGTSQGLEEFDPDAPTRVILMDGTPAAAHPAIDGGVAIEDMHNLVKRSPVAYRCHATEMASLILRGDLKKDGSPLPNSRILSIPLLLDHAKGTASPQDHLFVDLVHTTLLRAIKGDRQLAPDAFVVNFAIGVLRGNFKGRISSLARLIDWWASESGILFVVSAGNIQDALEVSEITGLRFENLSIAERKGHIRAAQRQSRHERTLLSPAEALNVLTVGAASVDLAPPELHARRHSIEIHEKGETVPAISSAIGLGPFRSIKPDLIAAGGKHTVNMYPAATNLRLRVVGTSEQTGLVVGSTWKEGLRETRARGTSCATALVTRYLVNAAAALTGEDGPFEGEQLSRTALALLTRALAINAAELPEGAYDLYDYAMKCGDSALQASEELARYFGYGFLDPELMSESPMRGATLVGLGRIRKDKAAIFDFPLPPSLSGESIRRSLRVTLAWFSPVNPVRARYRLAALEAVCTDNESDNDGLEGEWRIAMKSDKPHAYVIKRGTVWSRRLIQQRLLSPHFPPEASIPIRVQCSDASGGGLDPDVEIPFAVTVTLQLHDEIRFDVYNEIRDRLRIRLQQ